MQSETPSLRITLALRTETNYEEFTVTVLPEQFCTEFEVVLQKRVLARLTELFGIAEDLLDSQEHDIH